MPILHLPLCETFRGSSMQAASLCRGCIICLGSCFLLVISVVLHVGKPLTCLSLTSYAQLVCCKNGKRVLQGEPMCYVNPPEEHRHCANGVCPSIFLSLARIHHVLYTHFGDQLSNVSVSLGGNSDNFTGHLEHILADGGRLTSLVVEPSKEKVALLKERYANETGVQILHHPVSIDSVGAVMQVVYNSSRYVPAPSLSNWFKRKQNKTIDMLSIDVGTCDCHILQFWLNASSEGHHPKLLHLQVNYYLIPPIHLLETCDGQTRWSSNPIIWGCSIQAAYDILSPYGYRLLQFDWPYATFLHYNFSLAFKPLVYRGFLRNTITGFEHARAYYDRFNTTMGKSTRFLHQLHMLVYLRPTDVLNVLIRWQLKTLTTPTYNLIPHFRLEYGIAGSKVTATVVFNKFLPNVTVILRSPKSEIWFNKDD